MTASTGASVLEAVGVSRAYQGHQALYPTDLRLGRGEQVAIMGPSGSGKTTLINLLGGLDRPDAGVVLFRGQTLSYADGALTNFHRREVGFVFQNFALIPSLTVMENVEFTLIAANVGARLRQARCRDLLTALGLSEYEDRYPEELSGGQRQRVAVARSLAHEPSVVLADEPTGNLDRENGMTVLNLLSDACRARDAALLVVTHDPEVASRMDAVIHMRDGRILLSGDGTHQPEANIEQREGNF